MSRRNARESALQMLFQLTVGENDWQAAEETLAEAAVSEANAGFAREVVRGAMEKTEELDALIDRFSKQWQVERLANVDKTILRLALYELKYMPQTDAPIIINEAVTLAKIFGTEDSGAFVNGMLDAIYNQVLKPGV